MDKALLIDSFEYYEHVGTDRNHQPEYAEAVTIKHCRIDNQNVYARNANEVKVVANAIIFCYAEHTTPFENFKEQSKVVINGKDLVIERVVPISYPYSVDLFSIELEVL